MDIRTQISGYPLLWVPDVPENPSEFALSPVAGTLFQSQAEVYTTANLWEYTIIQTYHPEAVGSKKNKLSNLLPTWHKNKISFLNPKKGKDWLPSLLQH